MPFCHSSVSSSLPTVGRCLNGELFVLFLGLQRHKPSLQSAGCGCNNLRKNIISNLFMQTAVYSLAWGARISINPLGNIWLAKNNAILSRILQIVERIAISLGSNSSSCRPLD